jgi:hypothetical protein
MKRKTKNDDALLLRTERNAPSLEHLHGVVPSHSPVGSAASDEDHLRLTRPGGEGAPAPEGEEERGRGGRGGGRCRRRFAQQGGEHDDEMVFCFYIYYFLAFVFVSFVFLRFPLFLDIVYVRFRRAYPRGCILDTFNRNFELRESGSTFPMHAFPRSE